MRPKSHGHESIFEDKLRSLTVEKLSQTSPSTFIDEKDTLAKVAKDDGRNSADVSTFGGSLSSSDPRFKAT